MSTSPPIFTGPALPVTPANGGTGVAATGGQQPWFPVDNSLLVSNMDPLVASGTFLTVAGTVYLMRLNARTSFILTNLWLVCTTGGSGTSSGSFAGLYNSSGSLLSTSADIGTAFASTGAISTALTTPQTLTAGSFYWAAIVFNLATTQPTLSRANITLGANANMNLTAASFRFATNGTLQTSLPASITPASNVGSSAAFLTGGN